MAATADRRPMASAAYAVTRWKTAFLRWLKDTYRWYEVLKSAARECRKVLNDHQKIVNALRGITVRPSTDRCWTRQPAIRAIDCVLSLGHNYDRQVVKRLDEFERLHPKVVAVSQLHTLMETFGTRLSFVQTTLDWQGDHFAQVLYGVIGWLVTVSGNGAPKEQLRHLEAWARDAQPDDHRQLSLSGFGLAGFQYMRMLFGAHTTKPDLHINRWVSGVIGRKANDVVSLKLLEGATKELAINLRDLDTTLWESSAR